MNKYFLILCMFYLLGCGGGGGGGSNSTAEQDPFVISASVKSKSGSYGIGSEIEVTIFFKEEVAENSDSVIKVVFNTGAELLFTNISGSSATAIYIVKEGDNVEELMITSITIEGKLKDQAGAGNFTKVPVNINSDKIIQIDTKKPYISSFTSDMPEGFYGLGQSIQVVMNFNEKITMAGTMGVALNNGSFVTIDSFSGTEVMFSFSVVEDSDTSLLKVASISLSGEASDSAGNHLSLELPVKNLDSNKEIKIDTVSPYIQSFSTSAKSGHYGLSSSLELLVNFNESVILEGSLELTLNSGVVVSILTSQGTYASGVYTVADGQNAAKLSVSSFQINGTLKDHSGKSLKSDMPSINLDTDKSITIDTLNTSISSIRSMTSNGTYTVGKEIDVTINFEEEIELSGSLKLDLNSGGSVTITSFKGTSATGNYLVASEHNTGALSVTGISIDGTAKDGSNNDLLISVPVSNIDTFSKIAIDTVAPYLISLTSASADGTYRKNATVSLVLQLSESIVISGSLSLNLNSGGSVIMTSADGTQVNLIYTVSANENTSELAMSSVVVSGSVTDAAGNAVSTSLPSTNINTNSKIVIDSASGFAKPNQKESSRFLVQATFGPSLSEINSLTSKTYEDWLSEQMSITPTYLRPLLDSTVDDDLIWSIHVEAWWKAVIHGNDQLRQRVAFALSEILVISDQSGLGNHKNGLTNYYDILIRNAFGNYRELLEEVTLSPMMGLYLSMLANKKPDPAKNIRPDENYAREIMQLFSIGLYELNLDGTYKLDEEGKTIPTYSQKIIEAFAHIYTGWTYAGADKFNWPSERNYISPMEVWVKNGAEEFHDLQEQTLLNNEVLPANTNAKDGLKIALDNIFNHANVGPFISKQLIQRLITSNPSPAYVERVAKVFNSNSKGIRGDLKEVIEAIYLDQEARSLPDASSNFGKLKEPILRISALWRAFGGSSNSGKNDYRYPEGDLIQGPLKSPTVFNFFQPTYSHQGEIRDLGLVSPEFQIFDESSITTMSNRLYSFTRWRVRGHDDQGADQDKIKNVMYVNLDKEKSLASDPDALLDHLDLLLMHGEMSDYTRGLVKEMIEFTTIKGNESADSLNNKLRNRATDAIIMIMNSPDFNVQR